jgi:hypothetical protein
MKYNAIFAKYFYFELFLLQMGNLQISILILLVMAVLLLIVLVFCYSLNVVTWITAWVCSNREEKVGLTRSKGHYNANGYLVRFFFVNSTEECICYSVY